MAIVIEVNVVAKMLKESDLLEVEGMTDYEFVRSLDARYGVFVPELEKCTDFEEYAAIAQQLEDLLQAKLHENYVMFGPAVFFADEKTRALSTTLVFKEETENFDLNFEELDSVE